ncbi:MAG TPA: hypothetical protein VHN14_24970 [Kofleriaceae bacterium]|nr:hypothetical protein [Kofleriaceae bacterium]
MFEAQLALGGELALDERLAGPASRNASSWSLRSTNARSHRAGSCFMTLVGERERLSVASVQSLRSAGCARGPPLHLTLQR